MSRGNDGGAAEETAQLVVWWRRARRRLTNRPGWRRQRWQIVAVLLLCAVTVAFYAYLFGLAA
jgi:hypothetical protein